MLGRARSTRLLRREPRCVMALRRGEPRTRRAPTRSWRDGQRRAKAALYAGDAAERSPPSRGPPWSVRGLARWRGSNRARAARVSQPRAARAKPRRGRRPSTCATLASRRVVHAACPGPRPVRSRCRSVLREDAFVTPRAPSQARGARQTPPRPAPLDLPRCPPWRGATLVTPSSDPRSLVAPLSPIPPGPSAQPRQPRHAAVPPSATA